MTMGQSLAVSAAYGVKGKVRKARHYRRGSLRYENTCVFTVVFLIRRFCRGQVFGPGDNF